MYQHLILDKPDNGIFNVGTFVDTDLYLMPTYSTTRSAFSGAGYVYNASHHLARIKDGEIRAICGSENVEGPVTQFYKESVPFGLCGRCKQLAKVPK